MPLQRLCWKTRCPHVFRSCQATLQTAFYRKLLKICLGPRGMFLEGILQRPSRCLSVFKRHVLQRSSYNFCEDVVAIFAQISPREVAVNRLWRGSCESLAQSSWGTVAKVPCTVLFTEGLPRSCQRPCTIPFQKVFGQTFKSILGQSKRVHAKRSCTNSAMKTCAEILSPHLSQFWGPLAATFLQQALP